MTPAARPRLDYQLVFSCAPAPASVSFHRFMAMIKPFAALRPKPGLAQQICELPYDVLSLDEARGLAAGNPLSFSHVSRPEVDLPPGTDIHAPEVYEKGRDNFQKLISQGALKQDSQPCFYLYRQVMGRHSQTGLVATASCQEYLLGVIKKHELTRTDKEDDRTRHIEALNAQTGPVFLAHRGSESLDKYIAKKTSKKPEIDFTAADGVRHSSWTVSDADDIKFIEQASAGIQRLYIADGHHRSAAAARVFQDRSGAGGSGFFLAVIFPHDQMQILPYNRVLKDLNGWTPEQIMEILGAAFAINPEALPQPERPHEFGFYMQGKWHTLIFREKFLQLDKPDENLKDELSRKKRTHVEGLDVMLLQEHILKLVFGIEDCRTSDRIHFVGGIRGTAELEKLVNSGEYACAFSMFPTSMDDLMAVADSGGIMPPKSTWFEPKLRDGMFCHMI
jgi:uncharacterized protein (DUF1015 family)